jgi:hypothetical protein
MPWRIEAGPEWLGDDVWGFTIVRGRRSRQILARVAPAEAALRGGVPHSVAVQLVEGHLNDHVPPNEVALTLGWDYERRELVAGEMGFTNLRGIWMSWGDLARRLNLPHWLQPRS